MPAGVDIDIALAQCASRLKEQASADLFQVTARIAAMLDQPSLDEGENPIAPLELARALMQALARLDLHEKQRLIEIIAKQGVAKGELAVPLCLELLRRSDDLVVGSINVFSAHIRC